MTRRVTHDNLLLFAAAERVQKWCRKQPLTAAVNNRKIGSHKLGSAHCVNRNARRHDYISTSRRTFTIRESGGSDWLPESCRTRRGTHILRHCVQVVSERPATSIPCPRHMKGTASIIRTHFRTRSMWSLTFLVGSLVNWRMEVNLLWQCILKIICDWG